MTAPNPMETLAEEYDQWFDSPQRRLCHAVNLAIEPVNLTLVWRRANRGAKEPLDGPTSDEVTAGNEEHVEHHEYRACPTGDGSSPHHGSRRHDRDTT